MDKLCKIFVVFLSIQFLSGFCSCKESGVAEEHEFHADVPRVMKMIVNNIYKSKEVFLRELISNASDALRKLKTLSLDEEFGLPGDHPFDINIIVDDVKGHLIIHDSGVGMDYGELMNNIGTIAKSGTDEFMDKYNNNEYIGKFGVGFYSGFLVSDHVTIITKSSKKPKYIWGSTGTGGKYTIKKAGDDDDIEDPIINCGTKIILHLRDNSEDRRYMDIAVLKDIIQKHSGFIDHPIHVKYLKNKDVKVDEKTEEGHDGEREEEVERPEGDKEVVVERVNLIAPILTRKSSEVKPEEYVEFFKSFTRSKKDPIDYIHFESSMITTDIRGIIYIPSTTFNPFGRDDPGIVMSLYSKKVFITDDFQDLFPRYLSFVRVLVDVDNIKLNVSRETLQKSRLVREIKEYIVKKIFSMIKKLSSDEKKYEKFYDVYINHVKLGVISELDSERKNILASLLHYKSSYSESKAISLDSYIERMKEDQKEIYYVSGDSVSEMKEYVFLEKILKDGYEVLYMEDSFDEYLVQALSKYKDKKLRNMAKDGFTGDESVSEEERRSTSDKFRSLTEHLQKMFSKDIEKVSISNLLDKSPMVVISNLAGLSPKMEKMLRGNSQVDPMSKFLLSQKRILEINPNHPLMVGFLQRIDSGEISQGLDDDIRIMYNIALFRSGHNIRDISLFSSLVENMIREKYGIEKGEVSEPAPSEEDPFNMDFGGMLEKIKKMSGDIDKFREETDGVASENMEEENNNVLQNGGKEGQAVLQGDTQEKASEETLFEAEKLEL